LYAPVEITAQFVFPESDNVPLRERLVLTTLTVNVHLNFLGPPRCIRKGHVLSGWLWTSLTPSIIDAASIIDQKKGPLFRSVDKHRRLTLNPMTRTDVLRMIKRRAQAAELPASTCCHTFRATGITAYLEAGGSIENAQAIAAHESPRTTKLYDRTSDEITLDEVERIAI
jgi:integrase